MESHVESSLDLLKRAQAGDPSALEALIARYRPRLVRWASGRLPAYARDLCETQDLVQDSLIRAFRKIGQLEIRGEGALQAYLRQVLLNTIRMELRRVRRRPAATELESGVAADEASPLEKAIGGDALSRYERALDALRPGDRELVIAHVEFGFSHQELATAFGKPSPNAARMALRRALVELTALMKAPESS
ncbi:MAG TPA: RNA polymerase sigma factor [Vicinamibacterales bacterium]|nr:RNA polymerase sigma factor [Vicinamibacterales bacterium]